MAAREFRQDRRLITLPRPGSRLEDQSPLGDDAHVTFLDAATTDYAHFFCHISRVVGQRSQFLTLANNLQ